MGTSWISRKGGNFEKGGGGGVDLGKGGMTPLTNYDLYKSTIWPYMEHCCHVWAGAPSYYL